MNCTITSGMGVNCQDLKKPGGLVRNVWVGNFNDLSESFSTSGYVSDIELTTDIMYRLESFKFAHEANWRQVKNEGRHKSYVQTVTLNLINNTPEIDRIIEDISKAKVFFVVLTNYREFFIYGATFGLKCINGDGRTGREAADNTATVMIFEGVDLRIPARFLVNDYQDTLQYLDILTRTSDVVGFGYTLDFTFA